MRGARAAVAAFGFGVVAAVLVLSLSGFRGDTQRKSDGNYINDILVSSNGVYRFAKDTEGHTATPSLARSVEFLEIYNGTAATATFTLFCRAAPGPADTVLVYVPAEGSRSFPGSLIDSVRVTATFGGATVILGGMD